MSKNTAPSESAALDETTLTHSRLSTDALARRRVPTSAVVSGGNASRRQRLRTVSGKRSGRVVSRVVMVGCSSKASLRDQNGWASQPQSAGPSGGSMSSRSASGAERRFSDHQRSALSICAAARSVTLSLRVTVAGEAKTAEEL